MNIQLPKQNAPTAASKPARPLLNWASKLQSLTFSTAVHALLVLLLGGTVLFKQQRDIPDFTGPPGSFLAPDEDARPAPPIASVLIPTTKQSSDNFAKLLPLAPPLPSASDSVIVRSGPSTDRFNMPTGALSPSGPISPDRILKPMAPALGAKSLSPQIAAGIQDTTKGWAVGGRASHHLPIRSREFEFTAYVAKYQGGDWNSTVEIEDGEIWKGSLNNLLYVIGKLSKDKLRAEPVPVPLELTSAEIFSKKPPFIWFTGHRDFRLTDDEVAVLAEYLRRGGCIWGDSSLPGQRSRFDIAFRREMRRLVPDPNQPWQPLSSSHPVFTKAYYSEVRAVPAGMNYYDEPVYTLLGFGGEIAVLYTANDYGDMWQFGLDEKKQFDLSRDHKRRLVAINEDMWHRRNLYFRNIEPKALHETYKFGTNIIVHLLTRWEDKLRMVPIGGSVPGAIPL